MMWMDMGCHGVWFGRVQDPSLRWDFHLQDWFPVVSSECDLRRQPGARPWQKDDEHGGSGPNFFSTLGNLAWFNTRNTRKSRARVKRFIHFCCTPMFETMHSTQAFWLRSWMPWVHIEIMEAARCQIDPQIGGGSLPSFPATSRSSSVLIVFAFCWQSMFKISRMLQQCAGHHDSRYHLYPPTGFRPPTWKPARHANAMMPERNFDSSKMKQVIYVLEPPRAMSETCYSGLLAWRKWWGRWANEDEKWCKMQQAVWAVWNHVRVTTKSSEIKLVTFAWPSKLHYISLPSHSCF